jgi:hypothetical protein
LLTPFPLCLPFFYLAVAVAVSKIPKVVVVRISAHEPEFSISSHGLFVACGMEARIGKGKQDYFSSNGAADGA